MIYKKCRERKVQAVSGGKTKAEYDIVRVDTVRSGRMGARNERT
jgi:hypothetical protein